jgi:hypothetical protein
MGPLRTKRIQRLAESKTPTEATAIPASKVWVGSTVYMDESPRRERQVPMPTTRRVLEGERNGFIDRYVGMGIMIFLSYIRSFPRDLHYRAYSSRGWG